MNALFLLAGVVVATWNGNWFPAGREHRINPYVEEATVTAAGRMLSDGFQRIDPSETNDIILCLNEMRDGACVTNLIRQTGRRDLKVASVSAYRLRDRYNRQQDAIATTLPVVTNGWAYWSESEGERPPRGYAFAAVVVTPAVTATVYAVHLKSEYGARSNPATAARNRRLRTNAIRELLAREKASAVPVLIAGDFNADPLRREFAAETLFAELAANGFRCPVEGLSRRTMFTYAHARYGKSLLDYIYGRGWDFPQTPLAISPEEISDHRPLFAMAVPSERHT